jgi:hypothetical protein
MRDINNLMNLKNRHEDSKAQVIATIALTNCGKTTMEVYMILWNYVCKYGHE